MRDIKKMEFSSLCSIVKFSYSLTISRVHFCDVLLLWEEMENDAHGLFNFRDFIDFFFLYRSLMDTMVVCLFRLD